MAKITSIDEVNNVLNIEAVRGSLLSLPITLKDTGGGAKDITDFSYKFVLINKSGEVSFEKEFVKQVPFTDGIANLTITSNSGVDDRASIQGDCFDYQIYECNTVVEGDANVLLRGGFTVLPTGISC